MKNKNGFTLIELLAVITIIGIILLIAIPSIYLIVENSRRSAFAKLAHTYINAVKSLDVKLLSFKNESKYESILERGI